MDFTLSEYKLFLRMCANTNSHFILFKEYVHSLLSSNNELKIILRHDVDLHPGNALRFAQIQKRLNISGTYFFRMVSESYSPEIISKIADMGHEIGYHYEDIDLVYQARKKVKGKRQKVKVDDLLDEAIESFEKNLAELRKIYPVKTICMHGSPLSPFDNKALWTKYDYRDFGIIGEPYFDIDFDQVAYYTDTGRRWDGEDVSVRDKVTDLKEKGKRKKEKVEADLYMDSGLEKEKFPRYHSTHDIIKAVNEGTFPEKVMMTFHPQRWTNNPVSWTRELIMQNAKNIVKKYFFVKTNG